MSAAHAQPAGGGFAAQRERLVSALELDSDQQAKLDAIHAEMRPRWMALADMDQPQRAPAREKLMAEMRLKINAMLTPDQRAAYELMQARAAPASDLVASAASGTATAVRAASSASLSSSTAIVQPGAAAPPTQGGGPLQEYRNRLVAELRLDAAQAAKVDALFADARPRFMGLRELGAQERPKARERIMADLRARIDDLLSADQKPRFASLQAEAAGRATTRGRIYLLGADGVPLALNVRLGISDGSSTELLVVPGSPASAQLQDGAQVIIGIKSAATNGNRPASGPRLPF